MTFKSEMALALDDIAEGLGGSVAYARCTGLTFDKSNGGQTPTLAAAVNITAIRGAISSELAGSSGGAGGGGGGKRVIEKTTYTLRSSEVASKPTPRSTITDTGVSGSDPWVIQNVFEHCDGGAWVCQCSRQRT